MANRKEEKHYCVVTIAGGLGSQMAKYAFYILLNKKSKNTINLIDTYFYKFQDSWNGYELNKIFGIDAPNIVEFYDDNEPLINDYFKKAYEFFLKEQPDEEIIRVSRGEYTYFNSKTAKIKKFRDKVIFKIKYEYLMHFSKEVKKYGYFSDRYKRNWYRLNANVYYDEFNFTSDKYFREIKDEIVKVFTFPEFTDEKNSFYSRKMLEEDSVVMHVRRSDHMYDNGFLYKDNYYGQAVECIREHVEKPVFYIFSDEAQWCSEHREELGLTKEDEVIVVDWNKGEESYRDMQLMTYAKHNILAISSFSWWGYYLSKHKDKIVCSPKGYWPEVGYHF